MNEILIANLTLDTTRKNNIPPLVVPQGDYGARVIRAKITDLGKPVIVESTAAASIVATRSGDGESKAFSGRVNADGTVTVPVKQWMLDVPEEDVTCHIEATGIDYKYSTTSFLIEPQEKANPTEISEDDPRVDVVTEVLAGENTRRAAEAERVSNENARIAAENARQSAEEQRLTDESTRTTNEAQRVSAEASRDATFRSWAQDIASLPTFDGRISANRKRIENLESGIPAESFIIDESVAYTKDVPENVAPNAVVTKLGGMTYKSKNLIPLPYITGNGPAGGVTYRINSDASISFSGNKTGTSDNIVFHLANLVLPAGTYHLSGLNATGDYTTFHIGCDIYDMDGTWVNIIYDNGSGGTITLERKMRIQIFIRIFGSYTGSVNFTVYPMLNAGSTALPYEPYFEGLRSASVTEVKSVGANIWDEEWEVGGLNVETGEEYVASDRIRGRNYCRCSPNTNYFVPYNAYLVWYDIDKIYLGFADPFASNVSTSPDRAYYFKLCGTTIYGSAYNNDIIIAKGTTAQPYTPYVKHTLPIPEELRPANGINENVYDYIEWAEDGRVNQGVRCGVVDLGEQQWNKAATSEFYADIDDNIVATWEGYACLCAKYTRAEQPTVVNNGEMVLATKNQSGTAGRLFIVDSAYTDAAAFKAAMSGVMLVYELAEPIVTDISDLITADNLIGVEGGGTLTFENEHKYAVPSTIIYQSR